MEGDEPNPYASPQTESTPPESDLLGGAARRKAAAIIADANEFWLAILVCTLCGGVGGTLYFLWYLVRFLQWRALARSRPELLDPYALPQGFASKFQAAKKKLVIGMVIGVITLVAHILYLTQP